MTRLSGMPESTAQVGDQLYSGIGEDMNAMMTVEQWPVLVPSAQHIT